mmetsp:Transcript_18813/g.30897  ORF Transcript_18813/g.30897 Transcript_18813/m.30897 type:complete len:217 (+) Transcript_18813:1652-2302(+)
MAPTASRQQSCCTCVKALTSTSIACGTAGASRSLSGPLPTTSNTLRYTLQQALREVESEAYICTTSANPSHAPCTPLLLAIINPAPGCTIGMDPNTGNSSANTNTASVTCRTPCAPRCTASCRCITTGVSMRPKRAMATCDWETEGSAGKSDPLNTLLKRAAHARDTAILSEEEREVEAHRDNTCSHAGRTDFSPSIQTSGGHSSSQSLRRADAAQ